MQHSLIGIGLAAAALPAGDVALNRSPDDSSRHHVSAAGSQATLVGSSDYFTGSVRIEPVWSADEQLTASGAWVSFEAGARSAWHTHPAGQRLVVMSGIGLVQEWGKPVREIHPGDVVICPPGIKHWHGAAATAAMTHLAVTGVLDGKNVEWLEQVSDEQYNEAR